MCTLKEALSVTHTFLIIHFLTSFVCGPRSAGNLSSRIFQIIDLTITVVRLRDFLFWMNLASPNYFGLIFKVNSLTIFTSACLIDLRGPRLLLLFGFKTFLNNRLVYCRIPFLCESRVPGLFGFKDFLSNLLAFCHTYA